MENNANKNQWIDSILDSTRGMQRAQPGVDLYDRVSDRLARPATVRSPMPVIRWAAAAVFLVAVNITSVLYFNGHNKQVASATTEKNPLAAQIQVEITYNY